MGAFTFLFIVGNLILSSTAAAKPRARDIGIPFEGVPGQYNAITDVPGVEVGQVTIRSGKAMKGELTTARTGVTVILPSGKKSVAGLPGAWAALNKNGEITGVSWLDESGKLEGPIALTNTQSIGVVRDALVEWVHKKFPDAEEGTLPFVGETDDSWLNDLYGFHVKKQHVFEAADNASGGAVEEGAVGAGTGTVSFAFKAGIGTASRVIEGGYKVGVLVQSNFGKRWDLKIAGVPVGKELLKEKLPVENPLPRREGSIVAILGTDAPLLPHQMKRVVTRLTLGMGHTGGLGRNTSGDFFVGFSTVKPVAKDGKETWVGLPNDKIDAVFEGAVQSMEEAILNALIAAEDSTGINGNQFFAIPHRRVREILGKHGRLTDQKSGAEKNSE